MVLTDDNFASIEAAVEEGRGVYDNLVKFITWTLPTNFGEGLVILAAILAGATLPITPLQILWINMTTAVLLGLMLAFEPVEKGLMRRPPRPPASPILDRPLIARIVLVSVLLLARRLRVVPARTAAGAFAGRGAYGGGQCLRCRRDVLSLQLPLADPPASCSCCSCC
jgi:hypothetical protein